uniref:RHS repeat domain-containing protein n=1 Tax=Pedobacter schmidteae TaxID=2201271 RepID=UPI0018D511D1|nr:RHS repeat-associated core domain-containing protein [Pedobacter schmidteae]
MKSTNLLCILFFLSFLVRGQDIQSSGPIILPQAPASQYIIANGQTVNIKSAISITLLPGTHIQQGSNVSIKIGSSQVVEAAPNNPADDWDKNWVLNKSYDEDGNVVSESKIFFDYNGKPIQSQAKNLSAGHIIASQMMYDAKERGVGNSLAAPTNNSAFAYKADFINTSSAGVYSYKDFDKIPFVFDKLDTPDPVGNNVKGTLGWYYSDNNTFEPNVATTGFPYTRSDFYNDGSEGVKRMANVGDELRIGKGREESGHTFPVINELDNYLAIRNKFFSAGVMGSLPLSMKGKARQSVSIDQNGNQAVVISDLNEKVLMTARVGESQGLLSVTNTVELDPVIDLYVFNLKIENTNQGAKSFTVSSVHDITIYKNGAFEYYGKGNNYPGYTPIAANGEEMRITSDYPFYVSYRDFTGEVICDDCPSRIVEAEKSPVHYFQLFSPSNVTTSGSYPPTLYDMSKDGVSSIVHYTNMSPLAKGYYKLISSLTTASLTYSNQYSDISYNFYNQLGQLIATIAPEGVKLLITNGINAYASIGDVPYSNVYEYDLKGRTIACTETDAGRTEFVYRADGNVRFSQNAEQRKTGRFSYSNYDRWGRQVESGEYAPGTITFAMAKSDVDLQENIGVEGGLIGGSRLLQVKTHYDVPNNGHGLVNYVQDEAFLKGVVSFTENNSSKTWYNYDAWGRVTWIIKDIIGLGVKTINYEYDSKGNISKIDFQKESSLEQFIHEYEYDADNKLKVAYTSTATSGKKEQARYFYYLHGPLKRIELAEDLQGIDYAYTPQGWLKSINHPDVEKDPGKDKIANGFASDTFGMTLEYFNSDYTRSNSGISSLATGNNKAYYNGTIVGQSWKSLKPQSIINSYGAAVNNPAMVTYTYDDKYQFNNNKYGAPNFANNSFSENPNANREHNLSYDANGNIKTLGRTNASGSTVADYNYSYQNGTNKLASVSGYANYGYDDLGQMIQQTATGGAGYYVDYDVNGKVTAIYTDASKTQLKISFGYDEAGIRIRKTDHIQNTITYYVHDASGNVLAIYDNKGTPLQQKEVPVYAASRIGIYNRPGNSYQYELSDHLGNVRVVLNGTKTSNGEADVVYYSDYYPFGTALTLQGSNDYRYGYQGQYAEVDKETGWNSFELRMYDPAIGRWMNVDPYAEFHSPYVGMGNNPVALTDPDGGETDPTFTLKEVVITAGKGFIGGIASTMDYIRSQWTGKGYLENMANLATFGGYGSAQSLYGAYQLAKNVPNYNTNDYIYGAGFVAEKVIEAGVFKRVTSIGTRVVARGIVVEAETTAAKTGMTDLQLVTRAAQKAESAIGGTGRFAGTAKHTYANNLLNRYQSIYGSRGLEFNQYFNKATGRGFLDVVNHKTMMIYDYKFGSAVMGNAQYLKYSNSFPGYGIQIIRP